MLSTSCVGRAISGYIAWCYHHDSKDILSPALALVNGYDDNNELFYSVLEIPPLNHDLIAMLDEMYALNLQYYKELSMYIIAGRKRLEEVRANDVETLRQKAAASGNAEDAQAYNDLVNMCDRFEKKLHDLELSRTVSLQMGPQTRMLQNNDVMMVEKIQSSLVNTIPLWKSQMVLALGLENARRATEAQTAVSEMTNELLKRNADKLKQGSVEIAKEAERSIIDIETLQYTNEQLIATLDEVMQIQRDGAVKRKEAEAELRRIEGELKAKLMELK